jgi:4-amino-4-deoxy-L-arabinose transferase-like glycosyltransferase
VSVILAAHLLLGILYSVIVPMWEASDETGHFAFVRYLASERRFPPPGQDITEWFDESHQPPLYYILAALATSWIDTNDGLEPEINPYFFAGKGPGGVNIAVHSDREAFPYRGTALAMHVARLVSVMISTAVVVVTYLIGRFLFPQNEAIAIGAMALNAFWPRFLFLGAVVTNDILVPLFSSLVALFLLRIAYKPGGWKDLLGLGLCLGGGLATKMSAWGLIPLAVVAMILIAIRKMPIRARWWVLPLVWFCVASTWWWLAGVIVPDAWFEGVHHELDMRSMLSFIQHPLRQTIELRWDVVPHTLRYSWRTIWASYGWDNVGVEEWVYPVFMLLCFAGAIGLAAYMSKRSKHSRRFGVAIMLLGVLFVFVPPMTVAMTRQPGFLRGRIVSGAIPLLSLLIFLGLAQLVPRKHTTLLAIFVGGSLCALALIIPFRYIIPAYARPPILSAADVQDIQHPLEGNFGDKMELLGYDIDPEEARAREAIVVTLYWRALSEMEENYTVGVHLAGPDFEPYGGPDSYPARGNYATSLWKAGDIIRDTYWLGIPRYFPTPSTGWIVVTLYLHSSEEHLPVLDQQGVVLGYSALLGPFGVTSDEEPEYSIRYPLHYTLGDALVLLGYDMPDTVGPDLPLTLYWQGLTKMEEDYTVFVHVFDEQGNLLGQDDRQPLDGRYPTSLWREEQIVEDIHHVNISRAVSPGRQRLHIIVGMYLLETMERLPLFGEDGTRLRHDQIVILQDVQVRQSYPVSLPLVLRQ